MKLSGCALSLLLLSFSSSALALQIHTSKSTLTLPDVGPSSTENELRQAKAIVEIALTELRADVTALGKTETTLTKEAAAYEASKKVEEASFAVLKNKYDTRLAAYEAVVTPLTADILAFNALPADQRDAATQSALATRKASADTVRDSLTAEKTTGDRSKSDAEARLKKVREPLQKKIDRLNAQLGLAYRQLQLCCAYAKRVHAMLKARFNKHETFSPVLNGAMEQLKALASRGFDTP